MTRRWMSLLMAIMNSSERPMSTIEFTCEAMEFSVGDKLLITGPTTGVMYVDVDEIRYDLKPVETAHKGQHVSFRVPAKIRPSDKLFKIVPAQAQ